MAERYTPGYSSCASNFMARRSLDTHGAFFKPHLWRGARVLDCGCGPGTITIGISSLVGGGVTGVDAEPGQIELARELARSQRIAADFQAAGIYDLPFPDESFDAVFSHALFEHLGDPARAAAEILRVLRPGGVVGLRSPDWGGFILAPSSEIVARAMNFYFEVQRKNGGNLSIGRELAAICRSAGFNRIRPSASYECYEDPGLITNYLVERMGQAPELAAALLDWGRSPDALYAQAWCEVVAVKA